MESTKPKPFIFVLMPFDEKFDDTYHLGIKKAAEECGCYAERLDEQIFDEGMLERIFNQINKADIIVADMTGRNPNVFYEVGYAHALNKIVLLLTQNNEDIPFDLKHRQHIIYKGKITKLISELKQRLEWAIKESKIRETVSLSDRFQVSVHGKELTEGLLNETTYCISRSIRLDKWFNLRFEVRNGGDKTSSPVNHMYIFGNKDKLLVPCRFEERETGTIFGMFRPVHGETIYDRKTTVPISLPSIPASKLDSVDGLSLQYRLVSSLPPLPPGAVDTFIVSFMLNATLKTTIKVPMRLRIHNGLIQQEFPFYVECNKKETDEKVSNPQGSK